MMLRPWSRVAASLDAGADVALVTVLAVAGSTPREAGARIVLRPDGFFGTIGGGALEHEALAHARRRLQAGRRGGDLRTWPLGPDLGQCCGGQVTILTELFGVADHPEVRRLAEAEGEGAFATLTTVDGSTVRRRIVPAGAPVPSGAFLERFGDVPTDLVLFGAGHVGRAVVVALAPLPFRIRWVDTRPGAFPALVPGDTRALVTDDCAAEIEAAPAGAFVLVMTHSHPLDLAIVARALARPDLGYVGLIGSETKRARFARQLRGMGLGAQDLARLVCPVGVPGIAGKEPAVIAVAVAAQLLQVREQAQHAPASLERVPQETGA
jgi:xanthine dehydrogenase accessory factor